MSDDEIRDLLHQESVRIPGGFEDYMHLLEEEGAFEPMQENEPVHETRQEYKAQDTVNFFKQVAYISLLYMKQTTGAKIPSIYDAEKQKL